MKTNTKSKIYKYIVSKGRVRVHDLVREFDLSHVAIHKQVKQLVEEGKIYKLGKPPLVYYAAKKVVLKKKLDISEKKKEFLDEHYLYVSPQGEMIKGMAGFYRWAKEVKKESEVSLLVARYITIRKKINRLANKEGLIDITKKISASFSRVFVDKAVCVDFYSLPEFGKTRLGQLTLYAKQSQNRKIIKQLAFETKKKINRVIKNNKVEAVAFIPHSIPRKLQFLREYEEELKLKPAKIFLVKVYSGEVVVAQKSLSRLEERVENARETIVVDERKRQGENYETVLLIDDATGSGASVNEVAEKLKRQKIAKKVISFTLVSSFKSFDVIREI